MTALSTGAILSTYQRLRMEHVCQRLGLTSLAYMWQGHQTTLVDTMLSSGLEPVLVKVAGVGLEVDDVGRKLRDVRARLGKLVRRSDSERHLTTRKGSTGLMWLGKVGNTRLSPRMDPCSMTGCLCEQLQRLKLGGISDITVMRLRRSSRTLRQLPIC